MLARRNSSDPVRAAAGGRDAPSVLGLIGRLLTQTLAVAWCFLFLAMGLTLASSPADLSSGAAFGLVVPNYVTIGTDRSASADRPMVRAADGERELLEALAECGELTPTVAALRTSLTVDETAGVLNGMAQKGYLEVKSEDGSWSTDFGSETSRRLSAFTPLRLQEAFNKGRGRRRLRSLLRSVSVEIAFH